MQLVAVTYLMMMMMISLNRKDLANILKFCKQNARLNFQETSIKSFTCLHQQFSDSFPRNYYKISKAFQVNHARQITHNTDSSRPSDRWTSTRTAHIISENFHSCSSELIIHVDVEKNVDVFAWLHPFAFAFRWRCRDEEKSIYDAKV